NQPIGRGVGPVLEARDVMAVLKNEASAPHDLREHSLLLAARILEFDPALKGGAGMEAARKILESGDALAAMEHIIAAQGAPPAKTSLGRLVEEVSADESGTVKGIDCYRIARIARLAGAPASKGAGVDLLKKVGDAVQRGEPLYRIHAAVETDFAFATEMATRDTGYTLA
ncbi:MAG: thymidine phosphorylase, partial [Rhodospirillaceae bacterium]